MGLFRRGTKLLRLGSGLRDCCCRPEKPEECFCPSLCSYYVELKGYNALVEGFQQGDCFPPSKRIVEDLCGGGVLDASCTDLYGITLSPSLKRREYIFGTSYNIIIPSGFFGAQAVESDSGFVYADLDFFGEDPNRSTSMKEVVRSVRASAALRCGSLPDGMACWFLYAFLSVNDRDITRTPRPDRSADQKTQRRIIYAETSREGIPIYCYADASQCKKDPDRQCYLTDVNFSGDFHLPETVVTTRQDGVEVVIDGESTIYSWDVFEETATCFLERFPFPTRFPVSECGDLLANIDPGRTDFVFSFKKKQTCGTGTGDCDCEVDLTGRTVVFEGQTFTYGSLQQFISDDGLTIWEEGPSAGRFTRADRRECDPTVSMRVRTAEVSCSTFDGVPRWFVYLDSECYERESGGCAPTVTASKITLYNGAFSCDSDGYPLGAAHSFTDDTDPPDLDGETISGTPSTNCDVENPIPSISFS